jgi:plasmid stability protein
MSLSSQQRTRTRLSIDVEPDLRRRVKVAAAAHDLSIRDYLEAIIRRALADEQQPDAGWSALSARSFARDWDSEEDQVYDQLA